MMNRTPSLIHIMCVVAICVILCVAVFTLATSSNFAVQIAFDAVLLVSFSLLSGYALMRLRIELF